MENSYKDIVENNTKVRDLVRTCFKYASGISITSNNVAYLDDTCKEGKMQTRNGEHEVEETMICRGEYLKTNSNKFNVGFKCKMFHINGNFLTLEDGHRKKLQHLPLSMLRKHAVFNYCFACDSSQGSSIDGGIAIFDYDHCLVDKKML